MRSKSYVVNTFESYVTKITLELRLEVTLYLRLKST